MTNELSIPGGVFGDIIKQAIDKGTGVDALRELVALHNQQQDRAAQAMLADALASFHAGLSPVPKNRTARFATKAGAPVSYRYADLGQLAKHVGPGLAAARLSYAWSTSFHESMVTVTCTLTHAGGASRSAQFTGPIGNNPLLSDPQNAKVVITFGQRVSLAQVLGLTDTEDDIDGARVGEEPPDETAIDAQKAHDLEAWCDSLGVDKAKFLAHFQAQDYATFPRSRYSQACAMLKARDAKAREAKGAKP